MLLRPSTTDPGFELNRKPRVFKRFQLWAQLVGVTWPLMHAVFAWGAIMRMAVTEVGDTDDGHSRYLKLPSAPYRSGGRGTAVEPVDGGRFPNGGFDGLP